MLKMTKNQLLTLIYQLMVFNAILNSSRFSKVPYFSPLMRILTLFLMLIGVGVWFYKKHKINKGLVFVVAVMITISLIVMKESDSQMAILTLLYMMIINKDIEPEKFCKKYVIAATAAMCIVFLFCIIGIFPNEFVSRLSSNGLVKNRYYFGFNFATASANFAFHISLAYLFYRQDKFNIKDFLLLLVPNTLLYIYTNTRAAYFELLFIIVIFYLVKKIYWRWFKGIIGFLSIWLMPVLAIAELYVANHYTTSKQIYVLMDTALSYRLSWVVRALKLYPIGLFGNNITWASDGYTTTSQLVDMFYLRCAIQYGLIFLFVIILGFMGISSYFKYNENYYGCVIIITLAIHSITDPQLLDFSCVPLLIMLLNGYKQILDSFSLKNRKKRHKKNNLLSRRNSFI